MAQSQSRQGISTHLTLEQFKEFVLPHLHIGSRGLQPKLSLHAIFNYILKLLYLGCQWKELPIETNKEGQPEIHYTRIYAAFRRYEADGCFDAIFAGSVSILSLKGFLDISVSMAMERRPWRRKGATISDSTDTSTSKATK